MDKLIRCFEGCINSYVSDIDSKALTIIIGCLILAVFTGDLTMTSLGICFAVGGVGDVTGGLSVCIFRCVRKNHT